MSVVTKIALISGGAPVHVTVADQQGDPLPPANVTWTLPPAVAVTVTPTGFLFQVTASVPEGAMTAQASYQGPLAAVPVTGSLDLDISVGVTALEFLSP